MDRDDTDVFLIEMFFFFSNIQNFPRSNLTRDIY